MVVRRQLRTGLLGRFVAPGDLSLGALRGGAALPGGGAALPALSLLRGRDGVRRGLLGLLGGLGGGEWLGLVWQERSLCAIGVPRTGPEYFMVSILGLRLALGR
jgi:hypothetical protein